MCQPLDLPPLSSRNKGKHPGQSDPLDLKICNAYVNCSSLYPYIISDICPNLFWNVVHSAINKHSYIIHLKTSFSWRESNCLLEARFGLLLSVHISIIICGVCRRVLVTLSPSAPPSPLPHRGQTTLFPNQLPRLSEPLL